jgi:hypothetical protein
MRPATGLRLLVGITVVLAVAGVAVAGLLLIRSAGGGESGSAGNVMGQPVRTAFGTFTVTNARTTFVPDTQGPPTAAQHDGTKGSNQLQVWFRLTNEGADKALTYAPTQLRLVTVAGSGRPRNPNGSTIEPARLPRGGSVDGQVWFDLPKEERATARHWLEYTSPGGDVVRVPLDRAQLAPAPHSGDGADDHSQHDG